MRPKLTTALLILVAAASATATATLAGATPASAASLTDIENDVMCVSCREPLAVAQSPQAYAERSFIRTLIAQGQTKRQIERALVAQYGTAVLAKPPAHGFNLTVYILPPAILAIGIATLAVTLPKWRQRARTRQGPTATGRPLTSAQARLLEDDLARFDG